MSYVDACLSRMETSLDQVQELLSNLLGDEEEPITLAPVIPLFRKAAG